MGMSETDEVLGRVGGRVRARRAELGITARELAERSSISPRFVSELEAGRANIAIGRLASVARALRVPLAALVAEADDSVGSGAATVALLGLRGAGKTTLGRRAAEKQGLPFVELDDVIEEAAGLNLAEIFSLHGESYYRRLEVQCLTELLGNGRASLVALSGGVVQNAEAFELARRRCTTVWLQARPEDHMARVLAQGDRRPISDRADAMAELRAILKGREPLYRLADHRVRTSGLSEDEAVEVLSSLLGMTVRPAAAPRRYPDPG